MRLRIHPLSLWLAYGVRNPRRLQGLLPPELELAPVRLLADDTPPFVAPRLLFNAYDVSSTWMTGHRVEVQTLAVHRIKRTPHLVVLDVVTDAMHWDPVNGLQSPNAVVSRPALAPGPTPHGADARRAYALRVVHRRPATSRDAVLDVRGWLEARAVAPDRRFVVDANRACYFGNSSLRMPMHFQADALMHPVRRLARPHVTNELWRSWRHPRPSHVFVHERAMDFKVNVPGLWYDWW
jgi:hypothetical protein